jgi:hypothetical protein
VFELARRYLSQGNVQPSNLSFALSCTGMPDDCTVIVGHVVGRAPDDLMDKDRQ